MKNSRKAAIGLLVVAVLISLVGIKNNQKARSVDKGAPVSQSTPAQAAPSKAPSQETQEPLAVKETEDRLPEPAPTPGADTDPEEASQEEKIAFGTSLLTHLNPQAATNQLPSMVEFRTYDCAVCIQMEPVVEKVRQRYQDKANILVLNLEKDEDREYAARLGVQGVPSFLFLDANRLPVGMQVGALNEQEIDLLLSKVGVAK